MDTLPWNLYVTLPAPSKDIYQSLCNPIITDGWERINETLELFPSLGTGRVMRLTMVKGINMVDHEGYARLIEKASPTYVEVKAYMFVGFSRSRLTIEHMPRHEEIRAFADQIAAASSYRVANESPESRVVLLSR